MKKILSKFTFALVASFAVLLLATGAQAQRESPRSRGYTKAEVDAIIHRVESRSDEFRHLFDKALDNSRLDGTRREDELNAQAKRLKNSLDNLRREFDRNENYRDTRPQVSSTLDIAADINRTMRRRRLGGETERQWALLRDELNTLADVYELRGLR
ncbi:MAG TPA: hypothetical protein VLJ61_08125 [Pyrinomonadaceae bacterium]|nr:hypothetical protein [Pyrinomonadaceae bacterium]